MEYDPKPEEEIPMKNLYPQDDDYNDNDQQETSFSEQYQDLPPNHPLRKMWGKVRKSVRAADIVTKNEKKALLENALDIKVYNDYFSRLLLDNIEIGLNRAGEEIYVEYRDHKVYTK